MLFSILIMKHVVNSQAGNLNGQVIFAFFVKVMLQIITMKLGILRTLLLQSVIVILGVPLEA